MRGPLDRFLIKRPQSSIEANENDPERGVQAQANQATERWVGSARSRTGQEQEGPECAPLDDITEETGTFHSEQQQLAKRRRRGSKWLHEWQTTAQLPSRRAARLESQHVSQYAQRCILQTHGWQHSVLGVRGGVSVGPEQAGALQAVQFDSQGELMVTGSEEGLLTVHSVADLAAAAAARSMSTPATQEELGATQPLLVLDTGVCRLQMVRWNPGNENVVGLVSSSSRRLLLFDLQHTRGRPSMVLTAPAQASTALPALVGSAAVGMSDLAFFSGRGPAGGGGGYLVLAGGLGGQVFLWDGRTPSCAPTAVLQSLGQGQGRGAVHAVSLTPDEGVVLAGTRDGEVRLWDVRGGCGGAPRFGAVGVHHHPPLGSVSLRLSLAAVPGLLEQAGTLSGAVASMALDPADSRRLGFHLSCGWSGVLDLPTQQVTHLHAAAVSAQDAEQQVAGNDAVVEPTRQPLMWSGCAPALHRQACWAPGEGLFCVPSRREEALLLLDFSSTKAAGCYALRGGDTPEEGDATWDVPSAVHVQLSQPALCAAAHPYASLLVAGSMASRMSLLQLP